MVKPPLCKGRCPAGAEGLWFYGGRPIYGQGHNPPPPIGEALRARPPLSLRDISPHCGESPFTQGAFTLHTTNMRLSGAGRCKHRPLQNGGRVFWPQRGQSIHRPSGSKQPLHFIRQLPMLRHCQVRVNGQKRLGFFLGHFQRAGVLHQICHP